jgi:hypothetical protein
MGGGRRWKGAVMKSNVERLQAAGVILAAPLPEPYEAVVNGLSDEEVDVLVSIKQRLDEAGTEQALAPAVRVLSLIVI